MKLIWSPETATKAYIDTVKSINTSLYLSSSPMVSSVAELISAMAAGWKAEVIVETWSRGGAIATSIGLAIARTHTGGRHVCIVPDEESRLEYLNMMEKACMSPKVMVGETEEAVEGLLIDFLVVDCKNNEFDKILKVAKFGQRGAVLVFKNVSSMVVSDSRVVSDSSKWRSIFNGGGGWRVVRSVYMPVGKGLNILHVAAGGGGAVVEKGKSRWIRRVDRDSGEEFVIRK